METNIVAFRNFNSTPIGHRLDDGYLNATAMCQATGKLFADYQRLESTKAFLEVLSADMGIPISALIQSRKGGNIRLEQGTWVHPYVAINLGQWCSPEFAVFVSQLVFSWMNGDPPAAPAQKSDRIQELELQVRLAELEIEKIKLTLPPRSPSPKNTATKGIAETYTLTPTIETSAILKDFLDKLRQLESEGAIGEWNARWVEKNTGLKVWAIVLSSVWEAIAQQYATSYSLNDVKTALKVHGIRRTRHRFPISADKPSFVVKWCYEFPERFLREFSSTDIPKD
jgi:KilA-N domain